MKIERHRMGTDGVGVSTLVAFHGCPLHCKYCINDFCHDTNVKTMELAPSVLLDKVKIDDIFFRMTNGGIVFGGGEPLLHGEYIKEFIQMAPKEWQFRMETSLYTKWENIKKVIPYIDQWIIDVKDYNNEIYKNYTGRENTEVLENLRMLSREIGDRDRITIRIPLIEGFNTIEDCNITERNLSEYGRIDRFKYHVSKGDTEQ